MYAQVFCIVAVAFLVVWIEPDLQPVLHLPKQQCPMAWIKALHYPCQLILLSLNYLSHVEIAHKMVTSSVLLGAPLIKNAIDQEVMSFKSRAAFFPSPRMGGGRFHPHLSLRVIALKLSLRSLNFFGFENPNENFRW